MKNIKLDTKTDIIEDSIEEQLIENEEIEDDIENEIIEKKIFTDQGDPEIEGLHGRKLRGKLILRPLFQRNFVWDDIKCSKLIESALLGIPLPMIYLSEENDGKVIVIDGQQRLTAFFDYIEGKYSLKGLEKRRDISGSKNGKSKKKGCFFVDLSDEDKDKILYTKIRVITFKKECNENLKFDVFERLNTGAVSLNTQELRNCIYFGKYNELLKELSKNNAFKKALGESSASNKMKDVELVLRFASMFHRKYTGKLKIFMNDDMEKYRNISDEEADELRIAFKNGLANSFSLLGNNMFRRYMKNDNNNSGYWATSFNAVLFELLMTTLCSYDKNIIMRHLDKIREAWIDLLINPEFLQYVTYRTTLSESINIRFKMWRERIDTIIGNATHEPRCFSYELKKELYEANATCAICGNRIIDIDDAAVDHIEQYWLGGKTVPENARLTHRFCNNSRPRIENTIEENV